METVGITEEMTADLIGGVVITYEPPEGAEGDVTTVQGIFELGVSGRFGPDRIYIPLRPTAAELKALNDGRPMWLVILGHRMPVFQTYVQALPGEPFVPLVGGPRHGEFIAREDVRVDVGLHPRLHLGDDEDGSVYELSGSAYYYVEPAGTETGPES